MKITWETEITDLVDVDKTADLVKGVQDSIEKWTMPRIDTLELEMTVGGLSKQALIFDGETPLHNEAQKIVKSYENKIQEFKNFYEDVKIKTTDKRREELLKLQQEVQKKRDESERLRNTYSELSKRDIEPKRRDAITNEEYAKMASNCEQMIEDLDEKLKTIKDELGKV